MIYRYCSSGILPGDHIRFIENQKLTLYKSLCPSLFLFFVLPFSWMFFLHLYLRASFDWWISHSYLVFGPKKSWSRLGHFCIAASSSFTFKHFLGFAPYLMRAPYHYLTLAELGRCPKLSHCNAALCRVAWDKGWTNIINMTIEYPNYSIISILTKPRGNCVKELRLRN